MAVTGRTFAAVLFDNDGTLVDSGDSATLAWVAWAQEYDVSLTTLAGVHGLPARDIIARVAPHLDQGPALQRIIDLETEDVSGVVALPGAQAALAACAGRSALVTSATRELALARVAEAGLVVPEIVVSAEDITRGKPDPEPFLKAASELGVAPADCLVAEDAPAGIAAARAAGMTSLAVITTSESADELHADLVVPDLSHVRFLPSADGITVELVQD
ncbi:HAD-IA family hydrolase [Dermacoccaceae bacterium W4C1]